MAFLLPSAEALLGARGAYALHPIRAVSFSLNLIEELRSVEHENCRVRGGDKKEGTPAVCP